ncbi:hypothetical protein R5W24_006225 [Gemmata sp. JC717]|uniref:Uncharacterized protein n=1 Tax=Gemmata algarum TaxID=2975278 RepID=A0ABU5EVZ9_9BACT|nr:hypothetical protein [Gemmata algarum]MDY3557041.1 hypothetical protein [Gemmata algarum]MDY3557998.1 hypothetical protein [Gemmata algarum]
MGDEIRAELVRLIDAGDVYGLLCAAARLWVRAYHPDTVRAALYATAADDLEPMRLRIPLAASGPAPAAAAVPVLPPPP